VTVKGRTSLIVHQAKLMTSNCNVYILLRKRNDLLEGLEFESRTEAPM